MDKDTLQSLIGANLKIKSSDPVIGIVKDLQGEFIIQNVPVGRMQLECTHVGYESYVSDPFILNTADPFEIHIEFCVQKY
ncbi:MAG: hypothetical protein WAS55_07670 [Saprospiraceae bacterium]